MKSCSLLFKILSFSILTIQLSAQNKPSLHIKADTLSTNKLALNFLVVGDWGRNGEFNQKLVADEMGKAAAKINAKFVVSTGDNIYPSGVISEFDPGFHYSFENIYTASSLQCDWYLVLGNHDYKTNPDAEIAYSKISRRWKMPARYYSKKFYINKDTSQQVLMVFIDTNPFYKEYYRDPEFNPDVRTQDTTAQKKWMENILSDTSSRIKWKIVVAHHPLYTGGYRKLNPDISALRGSLKNIMDKYNVDLYLSGHEHSLQHIVPPGKTQYFISGAGSELTTANLLPESKFAKSENGFMAFSVTSNKLLVQVINYKGEILYKTSISK
jgi:3',5'-cyclic AMP phosphodiesterase CpdA